MSFLSYYNDDHGRVTGTEALQKFIQEEDWKQADFVARTNPLGATRREVAVPGFYDGTIEAKVLPHHLACQKESLPVSFVQTLQEVYADGFLTPESAYKRLPLHIACMNGASVVAIMGMIQTKENIQAVHRKDALGRLPIHYALKHSHLHPLVEYMVEACPGLVKVADKQGFLPIHVACRCGMPVHTVQLLLDAAPETVTAKTAKGSTPLMCAQMNKEGDHKERVLALIRERLL
jgi:hypothetical protein